MDVVKKLSDKHNPLKTMLKDAKNAWQTQTAFLGERRLKKPGRIKYQDIVPNSEPQNGKVN